MNFQQIVRDNQPCSQGCLTFWLIKGCMTEQCVNKFAVAISCEA